MKQIIMCVNTTCKLNKIMSDIKYVYLILQYLLGA